MRNANLPECKVRIIVMSGEDNSFIDYIEQKLKIKVIKTSASRELPYIERFHPDMQIHSCGGYKYFVRNSCSDLIKKVKEESLIKNISICEYNNKYDYPNNIELNAAHIGNYILCKKSHSNKEMLLWYINNGIKIIDIKQGYARCSTAIVSNNAIITDDESIYKACKGINDIDVLKINKGSIRLKGCDYGFIGGCCFKSDVNILTFFGDIKTHSDYYEIKDFCRNYGVELLSLDNSPLIDLGGVVIIE